MEMFKAIISGFINFARGLVRPAVTIGLVVLVCYLGIGIWRLIAAAQAAGQISTEQIMTLAQMVLQFLFTITAAVISFWFAERKNSGGGSTPSS